MRKRGLSIFLTAVMIMLLLPQPAHAASQPTTETAPATVPQTPEQRNDWILYAALAIAVLIPVPIFLLRRKKSK